MNIADAKAGVNVDFLRCTFLPGGSFKSEQLQGTILKVFRKTNRISVSVRNSEGSPLGTTTMPIAHACLAWVNDYQI